MVHDVPLFWKGNMYSIIIFGPDRAIIGWWRNFETGNIVRFASRTEAEQVIANWGIDGEVVEVGE